MKNLTYMPFKKNRYFYGKLLTAEDFEQEQQYFDDKRRLINRWVSGAGIVAGLEVIRVDDYSISVEMGLALDYTGREIVVEMPVIRKLSLIDGYEEATAREGEESLYLCIEYDVIPTTPVHNITNRAVHTQEEECFNNYREGYRLYVTDEKPDLEEPDVTWERMPEFIRDQAERIRRETYRQGIVLAEIQLVKSGEFYMIDRVSPLTSGQHVLNQPTAAGVIHHLNRRVQKMEEMFERMKPGHEAQTKSPQEDWQQEPDWQFRQGQVRIPITSGAKTGHCLFSGETAHGLGLGDVEMLVHVIQGNYTYGGAEEIFSEEEKTAEAAVQLSRNTGTFRIGIRLLAEQEEEEIWVGWTAIRKKSRNEIRPEEPRIYIHPGLVNLKTRESVRLEAVCVNMPAEHLTWNVVTPEGGTVETDGTYYAPNTPGVYEVCCKKEGQFKPRAVVYIVVRE